MAKPCWYCSGSGSETLGNLTGDCPVCRGEKVLPDDYKPTGEALDEDPEERLSCVCGNNTFRVYPFHRFYRMYCAKCGRRWIVK